MLNLYTRCLGGFLGYFLADWIAKKLWMSGTGQAAIPQAMALWSGGFQFVILTYVAGLIFGFTVISLVLNLLFRFALSHLSPQQ